MRVTVLGKSPSWQDAGGACTGYLVQEGATSLLLDCGNGVFGKLRAQLDHRAVDAVVVSHLHADHFLDLEAVAEQDEDQGNDGEDLHEAGARVELEHAERGRPEQESRDDEQRGQRQERALGERREQRADHQQTAEDRHGRLEVVHRGRVAETCA